MTMNIEELSKEVHVDLNGQITKVNRSDDVFIHFQCNDWHDHETTRKFIITCKGVVEADVRESFSGDIEFKSQHPLLWNHNEPHGYLYYSSEPKNRYEILGRIWEAHEIQFGGWRPLTDYANTYHAGQFIKFCSGTNGQLAQGPKPILDVYAKAITGLIETNYVSSHNPKGGFKALIFDNGFVICKSVAVAELGG